MMTIPNIVAIGMETPRIDSAGSLEKDYIEWIRMNHRMILYPTTNQVDSCYGCVHGPLI